MAVTEETPNLPPPAAAATDVCGERQRAGLFSPAEAWFVGRARGEAEFRLRSDLVLGFCRVNVGVPLAHYEMEPLMMADFLLRSTLRGAVIECGTYKGGSAAKLSLVAKATGRKLFVCDSFRGLPEPGAGDRLHHTVAGDAVVAYEAGQYAASLDEVKDNIARFGAPDACEFVAGFFSDSLPNLKSGDLSLLFLDVDYVSSARDCLRFLWPKLLGGGRCYTHEADVREFVAGVTDSFWWHTTLGQCPPALVGAGYGCGPEAPHLAYFDKSADTGRPARLFIRCRNLLDGIGRARRAGAAAGGGSSR